MRERKPDYSPSPPTSDEILSLDEIALRFSGKWVLLQVTEFDRNRIPARGHVVAFGGQKRVHTRLQRCLADDPGSGPYYVFAAQDRVQTGDHLRQVLAEAARRGDVRAQRPW
jgi:hypothetical protein